MARNQAIVVTGVKELDAKLRSLEPKLANKLSRKALRRSSKLVAKDAKRIIKNEAYDTGAFYKSIAAKAMKRRKGRIGITVLPRREKLAKERQKKGNAQASVEDYYYPASVEFGFTKRDGSFHPPVKPMRRALYENERAVKAFFQGDLNELIKEAQVVGTK